MNWQDDLLKKKRSEQERKIKAKLEGEKRDAEHRSRIQSIWNDLLGANSKLHEELRLPVRKINEDTKYQKIVDVIGPDHYCLYTNGWYIISGNVISKENKFYIRPADRDRIVMTEDGGFYFAYIKDPHADDEETHLKKLVYDGNTADHLIKNICTDEFILKGIDKGFCFIATAVYGDENTFQVKLFRHFRDEKLVKSVLGRLFVKIYYALSPPIANLIKKNRILKFIIKKYLLSPIVDLLNDGSPR